MIKNFIFIKAVVIFIFQSFYGIISVSYYRKDDKYENIY